MSLSTKDPFKLGLIALLVCALLGAGVVVLASASFGKDTYTAMLAQTAGLRAGEAVEVHGVEVGKVKSTVISGQEVKVDFTLDKDIKLGSDTEATVKVATLLGTHYLEVTPRGGCCLDGAIPRAHTSVPYNLQDVLNNGTGELGKLDPVALARALSASADALSNSSGDIGPALQGIAELSKVIDKRSAQTTELLNAAQRVSRELTSSGPDLVQLMKETSLVTNELTSRRQAIHDLLVETTSLSRTLTSLVGQTEGDLGPMLKDLDTVISSLNHQKALLQQTVETLAPAARYVANATGNGPWLDLFLKQDLAQAMTN